MLALSAGMCEGLDLGMNAMSSLVTRGCAEMTRYDGAIQTYYYKVYRYDKNLDYIISVDNLVE